METLQILEILICSTNQHQKYDIFHVEHFSQNSKLTLDCSHRDYRALVNKSAVIAVSAASITLSNAPCAQDNLSKLLTVLSAIAAPSNGTLQNLCTFLVRVPALGAIMVESAVSHLTRAR